MNYKERILELAASLFDVARPAGEYLILGLKTSQNQDIDEFVIRDGQFRFIGFFRYFSKKVNTIISFLKDVGFKAEQVRQIPEESFKSLAIRAGIGSWGKNSLVIHPEYGPWLRFVVIKTNFSFESREDPGRPIFPRCENCDECVKACPVGLLRPPFFILDRKKCLAYLDHKNPVLRRCDCCLIACPVKHI